MTTSRWRSVLMLACFVVFVAAPASAQGGVAKRTAKRAAKDATKDAAGDAAKKAAKGALAPDAIDLNAATPEQLAKLGFDEATVKKVVDSRPFASLEDPRIKEAIPAEALEKLKGKVTVTAPAKPASPAEPSTPAPTPPPHSR